METPGSHITFNFPKISLSTWAAKKNDFLSEAKKNKIGEDIVTFQPTPVYIDRNAHYNVF